MMVRPVFSWGGWPPAPGYLAVSTWAKCSWAWTMTFLLPWMNMMRRRWELCKNHQTSRVQPVLLVGWMELLIIDKVIYHPWRIGTAFTWLQFVNGGSGSIFFPQNCWWKGQLTSLLSFALTGESGRADSPAPGPQFRGHGVQYAPLQRELRGLPECHGQWPAGHFAGGTLRIEPERVCGLNGWILWQFPWIKNMLKVQREVSPFIVINDWFFLTLQGVA